MNSLNKHTPIIVFVIGLALLIFSIRTFFSVGSDNLTPIVNKKLPPTAPATGPTLKEQAQIPRVPTVVFRPAKRPPPVINRTDPREQFLKEMKKPAQAYLAKVGLRMNVPDGFAFAEEADGPVNVLIGASEPGKTDFYFFSTKGKYPVDRANAYIKEYFAEEMKVTPKGSPTSFYSRGGFSDMTQLRGSSGKGEYQAYYFTNKQTNQTHLMMVLNRNLNKSPARVRELVDSIGRAK